MTTADFASASFDALDVDLDAAREAYRSMWTPLAISLTLMGKSPIECRDVAARMEDDPDSCGRLLSSLKDGAEWYRQAAVIIESAEARFLCGAARLIEEHSCTK